MMVLIHIMTGEATYSCLEKNNRLKKLLIFEKAVHERIEWRKLWLRERKERKRDRTKQRAKKSWAPYFRVLNWTKESSFVLLLTWTYSFIQSTSFLSLPYISFSFILSSSETFFCSLLEGVNVNDVNEEDSLTYLMFLLILVCDIQVLWDGKYQTWGHWWQ